MILLQPETIGRGITRLINGDLDCHRYTMKNSGRLSTRENPVPFASFIHRLLWHLLDHRVNHRVNACQSFKSLFSSFFGTDLASFYFLGNFCRTKLPEFTHYACFRLSG